MYKYFFINDRAMLLLYFQKKKHSPHSNPCTHKGISVRLLEIIMCVGSPSVIVSLLFLAS